jgi:hypothetical protein
LVNSDAQQSLCVASGELQGRVVGEAKVVSKPNDVDAHGGCKYN